MSTTRPRATRAGEADKPERSDLYDRLDLAGRQSSTATVLFHSAVAERRGLSGTEEKALDILLRRGSLTHAELVAETGLKPASISDLVDRLERKGYAHRSGHPEDRRRVLITADAERIYADLGPVFSDWAEQLHAIYDGYTDAQLVVIGDFLVRVAQAQTLAAEHLGSTDGATDGNG